ncbi:DNSL2 protein, partial [Spelaeornis formosus]|nr:DNSL2 protein [Elachura formosa]
GRMRTVTLELSLLAVALLCPASAMLRIGAFNIQAFGDTKMSNREVAEIIIKVLRRYDAVLVQEVRDSDLSAVSQLMEQLNRYKKFSFGKKTRSNVLGQGGGTENNTGNNLVKGMGMQVVQIPSESCKLMRAHRMERNYSSGKLCLQSPTGQAPHDAVAEIDALYDVYLAIINKWGTDNMMFLGDFNADCSYVQPSDWSSIRLRSSDVFKWLIPDSTDTTVGKSDCAYDRIVVCGNKLKRSIVSSSAGIYNFQRAFQLDQEEALAVSDHYPVEVKLAA